MIAAFRAFGAELLRLGLTARIGPGVNGGDGAAGPVCAQYAMPETGDADTQQIAAIVLKGLA